MTLEEKGAVVVTRIHELQAKLKTDGAGTLRVWLDVFAFTALDQWMREQATVPLGGTPQRWFPEYAIFGMQVQLDVQLPAWRIIVGEANPLRGGRGKSAVNLEGDPGKS